MGSVSCERAHMSRFSGAKLVNEYNRMVHGSFRLKLNGCFRTGVLTTAKVK